MNISTMPAVRRKDGSAVSAKEAKEISTKPVFLEYEYNDCIWTLAFDPRIPNSADEQRMTQIQLALADAAGIKLTDIQELSATGEPITADKLGIDMDKYAQMSGLMREMEVAQIKFLAPGIIGCNDPAEENQPSIDRLLQGGKLASIQLEALTSWWNPTEAGRSEVTKTTEEAKSTGLQPSLTPTEAPGTDTPQAGS
jgi:hypothetical protein